jgi:DNA polymerase-3 subunit alpha
VASRKVIFDKKGKPMAFVKLEDFVGAAELILFADAYQKYEALLVEDAVVVVSGRASAREEQETKLLCDTVWTLDQAVVQLSRALHLDLDAEALAAADVERLQSLLAAHPGKCEVFLRLRNATRDVRLRSRNTHVAPTRALLEALRAILGAEHVRLDVTPPVPRPPLGPPSGRGGPRRDTAARSVDRAPAVS